MPEPDDTVLTEGHGTLEDTAPIAVRRTSRTAPASVPARALPPQAPPVTDIHLLDFRLPDVPSGGVVRYKPRTDPEIAHVPDFDASWKVRQRTPQAAPGQVVARQRDDRRVWRRRALVTVAVVSAVVLAGCAAGIWALQRL